MRFYLRRIACLAIAATCAGVIFLNLLRPQDFELVQALPPPPPPPVDAERRPARLESLDQRLARYSSDRHQVTASEVPLYPELPVPTRRKSPMPPTPKSKPSSVETEETFDVLTAEGVSGSENEGIRRYYVHLPAESRNGVDSIWWSRYRLAYLLVIIIVFICQRAIKINGTNLENRIAR